MVCSLALITLSMAMGSMLIDALVCKSKSDTTPVKLVAPVPLAVAAAALAPTMTASSAVVLSVPVFPVKVSSVTRLLMVVCMLPPLAPLAVSTPDKAARTAPYFSPGLSASGVKLAFAPPVASTVVTMVVPVRSLRPKALATAALVCVTTSAVITLGVAPGTASNTAPALVAAMVVRGLMLRLTVPVLATPTAINWAVMSRAWPLASSM